MYRNNNEQQPKQPLNMELLNGKYSCIKSKVITVGSLNTILVQNAAGEERTAIWMTGIERHSIHVKATADRLKALQRVEHSTLPKIEDLGYDEALKAYVVVTAGMEKAVPLQRILADMAPNTLLGGLLDVARGMSLVHAKTGLTHGRLHTGRVMVAKDGQFLMNGFGLEEMEGAHGMQQMPADHRAPEVLLNSTARPSFRADVFAYGLMMRTLGEQKGIVWPEATSDFLQRMSALEPTERPSWTEVIDHLGAMGRLSELEYVLVGFRHGHDQEVLDQLAKGAPKVRVGSANPNIILDMILGDRLHEGVLWLKDKRMLLFNGSKPRDKRFEHEFKTLPLRCSFGTEVSGRTLDLAPILDRMSAERERQRNLQKRMRDVGKRLGFYRELLEKELSVIEQNAFKAEYTLWREEDGIVSFKLKLAANCDESCIKEHVLKGNAPDSEGFQYVLSNQGGRQNGRNKGEPKLSGKPFDFNTDGDGGWLKIKDLYSPDMERLPQRGWLMEDITLKQTEKKRQLDAIMRVDRGEVRNPNLIHALFDPGSLRPLPLGDETGLEQIFQKGKDGQPIPYNQNQLQAIRQALTCEPMSLIQGPPGTGKTTVITEIVFQMLNSDPTAKILITSQTNNAVDQVLENLVKNEIPILRLKSTPSGMNPEMRKHTIQKKLEGWKEDVKRNATKKFNALLDERLGAGAKEMVVPVDVIRQIFTEPDQGKLRRALEMAGNRIKGLEGLRDLPKERDAMIAKVGEVFKIDLTGLGELENLHRDWLRTVSGLSENGAVNQRLVDSVRVIGSTCNHIASGQYAKLNFRFDYVIMDESGKATTAEALVPITMGSKLVFVGDHRQLKPMLSSDRTVEQWLRDKHKNEAQDLEWEEYFNRPSLFEEVIEDLPHAYRTQLTECRRSSKDQIELTSRCFYEPHGDEPLVAAQRSKEQEHGLPLGVETSIVFVDIGKNAPHKGGGRSPSLINPESAKAVLQVLDRLDRYDQVKNYSIGVITAYGAQWQLLGGELRRKYQGKLHNVSKWGKQRPEEKFPVSVIDRFQGNECDIVILDLVRGGPNCGLGFLEVPNRINVALSRQKRLLIIVGDYHGLLNARTKRLKGERAALQNYLQALKPEWIINTNNINTFFQ
jgi:hypothetical protein